MSPAPGQSESSRAGTSARREHARRHAAEGRRRRAQLPLVACVATASAVVAVGLVLGVAAGIDRWLQPAIGVALPGALVREAAGTSGLLAAASVLLRASRINRSAATRAWGQGADGELAAAAALAPLERDGWLMIHDRRLPGGRGNVDHIAVGPGGVWVIETKHWSGQVVVGADRLRVGRRSADAVYDQVWRQADEVTCVLSRSGPGWEQRARPVVCVVGAELVHGRDQVGRPVRGAVEFHSPASLARRLHGAPPVLSPEQVRAAAAAIDRALPAA